MVAEIPARHCTCVRHFHALFAHFTLDISGVKGCGKAFLQLLPRFRYAPQRPSFVTPHSPDMSSTSCQRVRLQAAHIDTTAVTDRQTEGRALRNLVN